jgi:hypothetical protein
MINTVAVTAWSKSESCLLCAGVFVEVRSSDDIIEADHLLVYSEDEDLGIPIPYGFYDGTTVTRLKSRHQALAHNFRELYDTVATPKSGLRRNTTQRTPCPP